ncbi:SHOCT domain-containing protein [Variovorax dokdonensis]|uniref:SHOCT domain-containing protein n=1 Tax=Variovorax dokdonensis TaxID=344883 RepID=A0ABT7N6L8_9BURK|nr:SHOCT domain-containing protein [Variovorax dokdonensis]MDM0043520.1 SHOCT domain-containing protein [Variovorax dokdonensis]
MKHALVSACVALALAACASPPEADPSLVEAGCAQQCSVNLSSCSSGFKMFPVVQQKQCNDTYDVCIKGCPARSAAAPAASMPNQSAADRLKAVDDLYRSGAISKDEHALKRKQILDSL